MPAASKGALTPQAFENVAPLRKRRWLSVVQAFQRTRSEDPGYNGIKTRVTWILLVCACSHRAQIPIDDAIRVASRQASEWRAKILHVLRGLSCGSTCATGWLSVRTGVYARNRPMASTGLSGQVGVALRCGIQRSIGLAKAVTADYRASPSDDDRTRQRGQKI